MKKDLHPKMHKVETTCVTCGTKIELLTTKEDVKFDTCSNCHPFYTGKATSNSKAGRVERFNSRLNNKKSA